MGGKAALTLRKQWTILDTETTYGTSCRQAPSGTRPGPASRGGGGAHEAAAGRQLLLRSRSHMAAPGEQCGGGGRASAAPLCWTWSCPGLHCLPPPPIVAQLPAGGPAVDLTVKLLVRRWAAGGNPLLRTQ